MRLPIALVAAASLLAACGGGDGGASEEDQVLRALRDQLQAVHNRDGKRLCAKLFASTDLPRRLARDLDAPEGEPGSPAAWDEHYRECVRDYAKPGAFHIEGLPKVQRIDEIRKRYTVRIGEPVTDAGGITRMAKVGTKSGAEFPAPRLVKYRGDWKVVFEVN